MAKYYAITREKFFTTEERRAIIHTCEDMSNADLAKGRTTWPVRWMLVHLAMYSGLRVSEIAHLRIGDLYLNNHDPYLFVRHTKRHKYRDVYVDRELVKHLREFIQLKHGWRQPTDDDTPLLSGRSGKPFTTNALYLSFKQAIQKAGLRSGLSIHSARHSYATMLLSRTGNLREVKNQLGHSNIAMTALYADILPEERSKLANMILDEDDNFKPNQS
jgi:integrase/recombinase XerD